MKHPYKPEAGMRVVYGRKGFERTGYTGRVVSVDNIAFEVEWFDLIEKGKLSSATTRYRLLAWANTQLDGRWRDRDKHYIFFDEESKRNRQLYPEIFNCGKIEYEPKTQPYMSLPAPALENDMHKTLVKQTLVKGNNIKEAGEDALIKMICDLEGDILRLKGIKAESTRIGKMIKEREDAIKEVVKELDSRN